MRSFQRKLVNYIISCLVVLQIVQSSTTISAYQNEIESLYSPATSSIVASNRELIYVLEDKDYPQFLFENYTGVGQVSGITVLPSNDLAIIHRSDRKWTADAFDMKRLNDKHLIKNNTIMILDGNDGSAITTFGSDLFFMPHGISSDLEGNLWVTDVGRHQVMRLPVGGAIRRGDYDQLQKIKPDIVLGQAFKSGADEKHFCKPAETKISSRGDLVFVADGYCNNRVVVFDSTGSYITSFGQGIFPPDSIIHSLALIEKRNMICVSERTNGNIYCFKAGSDGQIDSIGELVTVLQYPLGEVYAIVAIGPNTLLVSSKRFDSERYDMATLDLITGEVKPTWISGDLLEPHSMARTIDGFYVYVADLSPDSFKKVFKFKIIKGRTMIYD